MEKKETEKKVVKKASEIKPNYNLELAKEFAQFCAKKLNCQEDRQKINRKETLNVPKLTRNGKTIAWILPRASKKLRFTIYVFYPGKPRGIINVTNDDEQNKAFDEITAIYNSINDKPTKKKVTTPKKNNEIRPIDKIIEQLKGLGKNKGLAIPNGYDATDNELVKAVEKHGFRIDAEKKIITRA